MEIKVFGTGCSTCADTEKMVREVALSIDQSIVVQKVSDLKEMMAAGILSAPAIMVDGVIKCTGRVPTKGEVAEWIGKTKEKQG